MRDIERREALRLLASAAILPLLGCGSDASMRGDASVRDAPSSACTPIPEETDGPYPANGTNGPNALATPGIVRSDIRSSFGPLSGTAEGVPFSLSLTLVNANAACAPLVGYAVYLWHCDRDGLYSLYGVPTQNYLRGVQETDVHGQLAFRSIFPGTYASRWPHIHFAVYRNIAEATSGSAAIRTSQLALPTDACSAVFASPGYESSMSVFGAASLSSDMVFGDGSTLQMASITGSVADGYFATLAVGIAV